MALLRRVASGDAEALGLLYDRYGGQVFSVALRITGDRGSAEEVAQDTFLRLWEHAARYDPERGNFGGWLRTIAHRLAIDELRSRRGASRRREFALPESLSSEEAIADTTLTELRTDLQLMLAELPPAQREAIENMFFGGLSPQEIARRAACPLATIYTRLRTGMEKLRTIFQRGEPSDAET